MKDIVCKYILERVDYIKKLNLIPVSTGPIEALEYQRLEFVGDSILNVEAMKRAIRMFPFMTMNLLEKFVKYAVENKNLTKFFRNYEFGTLFPQVPINAEKAPADAIETLIAELHEALKRRLDPKISDHIKTTIRAIIDYVIYNCLRDFMMLEAPSLSSPPNQSQRTPSPPIPPFSAPLPKSPSQMPQLTLSPSAEPRGQQRPPSSRTPPNHQRSKYSETRPNRGGHPKSPSGMQSVKEPVLSASDISGLLGEVQFRDKRAPVPPRPHGVESVFNATDFSVFINEAQQQKKKPKKANEHVSNATDFTGSASGAQQQKKKKQKKANEPIFNATDFSKLIEEAQKEKSEGDKVEQNPPAPKKENDDILPITGTPVFNATDFSQIVENEEEEQQMKEKSEGDKVEQNPTSPKKENDCILPIAGTPVFNATDFSQVVENEEAVQKKKPNDEGSDVNTLEQQNESVTLPTLEEDPIFNATDFLAFISEAQQQKKKEKSAKKPVDKKLETAPSESAKSEKVVPSPSKVNAPTPKKAGESVPKKPDVALPPKTSEVDANAPKALESSAGKGPSKKREARSKKVPKVPNDTPSDEPQIKPRQQGNFQSKRQKKQQNSKAKIGPNVNERSVMDVKPNEVVDNPKCLGSKASSGEMTPLAVKDEPILNVSDFDALLALASKKDSSLEQKSVMAPTNTAAAPASPAKKSRKRKGVKSSLSPVSSSSSSSSQTKGDDLGGNVSGVNDVIYDVINDHNDKCEEVKTSEAVVDNSSSDKESEAN